MPKLCETFIETRVQKFVGGLGECVEGELGKHREAQAHSNHIDLGIDSEIDRQLDAYLDLPVEWPVLPSSSSPPLVMISFIDFICCHAHWPTKQRKHLNSCGVSVKQQSNSHAFACRLRRPRLLGDILDSLANWVDVVVDILLGRQQLPRRKAAKNHNSKARSLSTRRCLQQ